MKAFAEPVMQRKIAKCHDDHWHSDLMVGLYSIHQYQCHLQGEHEEGGWRLSPPLLDTAPCAVMPQEIMPGIYNHIRAHYRLLLECSYSRCIFVEADCTKMYEHGVKKHNHTKAAKTPEVGVVMAPLRISHE